MSAELVLIPSFIGETESSYLPLRTIEIARGIHYFIVEKEKTARAFLKQIGHPTPQSELHIYELNKHEGYDGYKPFFDKHIAHNSIGLISEAGLPAVADPGSAIVAHAHRQGIRVLPLSGSSSIFLALMGSGMNGQEFAFHGYLPIDTGARIKKLKELERESKKSTQIFMETPYRNMAFLEFLIKNLQQETQLCVATALETEHQLLISKKVKDWDVKSVDLHKKPCIYLIG